jgi:hypothetical protein
VVPPSAYRDFLNISTSGLENPSSNPRVRGSGHFVNVASTAGLKQEARRGGLFALISYNLNTTKPAFENRDVPI